MIRYDLERMLGLVVLPEVMDHFDGTCLNAGVIFVAWLDNSSMLLFSRG